MNRRALTLALVLAGLGTLLLLLYLRRYEIEMSGGERVEVLTVIKPIARGAVITDDMLATRGVPVAYVEDRAVKAAQRAKVLGLQTATAVSPQQTLLWTDLAITTEDRDLSSLVQPGKRGVTVRAATGADDSAGLIRPGDYVDVIVTMASDRDATEETSVVLLQRVLVLAVGRETGNTGPEPKLRDSGRRDRALTLSLNLQETQLVGLALERGRLSVAVRNPNDPSIQEELPDMKVSALLDSKARADVQRPSGRTATLGPTRIQGAATP